jgi:molybdenum cofactor cytidylyltransferase
VRTLALVAAAGASARFGRPKALLPWDAQHSFLTRIVSVLREAIVVPVVVTHPNAADLSPAFVRELSRIADHADHVEQCENQWPALGLSGSVRTALEEYNTQPDLLLVWPVDCPFADVSLVRALVDAVSVRGEAAVPLVDGKRGHPVVFLRSTFELLVACAERGGPRAALDALGDDVVEVPWSDPRVAHDVDTVDDYRNLFGREP